MKGGSWPTTAADVSPTWLTAALADRHPGAVVDTVEVIEEHEVTNAHARLRVAYSEQRDAPEVMFCKLPPTDERRAQIIATGMGHREARFYAELAPSIALRVPHPHVARTDDDGHFALLLEDLVTSGCAVSDGTWGIPVDAAAGAIEDLAALREGIEHHRDRLTDSFVEIAELYIARHDELQVLWHEGPHTVIHGDTHIGNLFLDDGRVGFLDWGIINVNTPMRDISYFMTMAMAIEDRRAHERELLRLYLDVRRAAGVTDITFDDAWRAHRIHASYNVPASCQVVRFPVGISEERRIFADAFLARAQASLDDLDARGALRDAGL